MKSHIKITLGILMLLVSCRVDEAYLTPNGYPKEVNRIITGRCAVAGCHNEQSKEAAGGLSLISWDKLMEGGRGGAVAIPYRADQSSLFYFINTYADLGIRLKPTMPFNQPALSRQEVIVIRDWMNQGAPNDKGFVKFSDNPLRKKIYVTNQGCDGVTVLDADTRLAMRYVDVGATSNIESPHMIKVSPDKRYWYVIFSAGQAVQKFDASTDTYVGEVNIGAGNWNTFTISPDGRKAFVVNWSDNGSLVYVDLENLKLLKTYQGTGLFYFPHGIAANQAFTTLYVTGQTGNFIYKIDITDINSPDIQQIVLETGKPVNTTSILDPHEIVFSPDESRYFVTCQKSNEVRVIQTANDSLIAIISTGVYPVEMAMDASRPYLFVTCMETPTAEPTFKGSVVVLDYLNLTKIKEISGSFFQPHGIAIDETHDWIYVASRNYSPGGPAPHHASSCAGRNGFMTLIDGATLEVISSFKTEVSVDPYSVAVRK